MLWNSIDKTCSAMAWLCRANSREVKEMHGKVMLRVVMVKRSEARPNIAAERFSEEM